MMLLRGFLVNAREQRIAKLPICLNLECCQGFASDCVIIKSSSLFFGVVSNGNRVWCWQVRVCPFVKLELNFFADAAIKTPNPVKWNYENEKRKYYRTLPLDLVSCRSVSRGFLKFRSFCDCVCVCVK